MAFHPYPQVIRAFCNRHRFGPPRPVRDASACPWVAHPVSGLSAATNRPIQARFHYGYAYDLLSLATSDNSPDHTPKGTRSGGNSPSHGMEAHGFRFFSLPSPGFFSPFPHGTIRYRSSCVVCLGSWSTQLRTRYFVPRPTQGEERIEPPAGYATIMLFGRVFQTRSPVRGSMRGRGLSAGSALQPQQRKASPLDTLLVWAVTRFVRHYYGCRSLFLGLRKMFQLARFPPQEVVHRNDAGCPIRRSLDQCVFAAPQCISVRDPVLRRHSLPRHPPCAHIVFVANVLAGTRR